MKQRITALVLLVCMAVAVFAGCAETEPYSYDMSSIVSLEANGTKFYSAIELKTGDIDEELKAAIQEILDTKAVKHEQNKDNPDANAVVEDGDTVNIDYKGSALGKELTGYSFDPASPKEFPTDLKDKLNGLTIGAGGKDAPVVAEYTTTIPSGLLNSDNTASDFAGKEIKVTVYKIQSVTRKVEATATTAATTTELTSGEYTFQTGDVIKLDLAYTFTTPVAFQGGTTYTGGDSKDQATGYDLKIGSKSFVDDFETELIGAKLGDTRTVNVTFPADYSQVYLQNMIVDFETAVNYLSRSPKELTDEMVKEYTENARAENGNAGKVYTTAEEYKTEMRKSIVESMAFEVVLGKAVVLSYENVPELKETYDAYFETIRDSYNYFRQSGYFTGTYDEYLVSYWPSYYLFGQSTTFSTPEALASYVMSLSKADVKKQLVLHAIAQVENLSVSEEEYTSGVTRLYADYKSEELDTEKKFVKEYGEENLRRTLLLEKVYDMLRENVTEVAGSSEDE